MWEWYAEVEFKKENKKKERKEREKKKKEKEGRYGKRKKGSEEKGSGWEGEDGVGNIMIKIPIATTQVSIGIGTPDGLVWSG